MGRIRDGGHTLRPHPRSYHYPHPRPVFRCREKKFPRPRPQLGFNPRRTGANKDFYLPFFHFFRDANITI